VLDPAHHPPPQRCFWELTRACDHLCLHCRSRSGEAGAPEMPEDLALDVADQLVALGPKLVALTGGEPLLHPAWERIAARLTGAGIRVRLFTGGAMLTDAALARARSAGVDDFALSLDGPPAVHDRLRPLVPGGSSFDAVVAAIGRIQRAAPDAALRVVTTVSAPNVDHLGAVLERITALGVRRWQLQLARLDGRALDHGELLALDPGDVERVIAALIAAARGGQVVAPMHCSVGWLTEEEPVLRDRAGTRALVWSGAQAGLRTLAIDARGGVRACACLPDAFVAGSLLEDPLAAIWRDDDRFAWARRWDRSVLSGDCAACALGDVCRAGCPSVAWTATGSIGANPYCLRITRARRGRVTGARG
jgi:radical SAM protein with 4Fe4S-binding SPASM domain